MFISSLSLIHNLKMHLNWKHLVNVRFNRSFLSAAQTHLGRPSHSRGSSPGWTRRPGRSSRCHRTGQTSTPCWCMTGPGRCSTDPLPDSPTDRDPPGVKTPRGKAERQSCSSSRPSSRRSRHALCSKFGELNAAMSRAVIRVPSASPEECCAVKVLTMSSHHVRSVGSELRPSGAEAGRWVGSYSCVNSASLKGTVHHCKNKKLTKPTLMWQCEIN